MTTAFSDTTLSVLDDAVRAAIATISIDATGEIDPDSGAIAYRVWMPQQAPMPDVETFDVLDPNHGWDAVDQWVDSSDLGSLVDAVCRVATTSAWDQCECWEDYADASEAWNDLMYEIDADDVEDAIVRHLRESA